MVLPVSQSLETAIRIYNLVGSVVGVAALLLLMSMEWRRMTGRGQRLRYWTLVCYVVLIAGTASTAGTYSLGNQDIFGYRNYATALVTTFLLIATAVTCRDTYKDWRDRES